MQLCFASTLYNLEYSVAVACVGLHHKACSHHTPAQMLFTLHAARVAEAGVPAITPLLYE